MKKFGLIALMLGLTSQAMADGFAGHVVSYNAGLAPGMRSYFSVDGAGAWTFERADALIDPLSALGKPTGLVKDEYFGDMIVSPFNPTANAEQIVSIGEGGSLTLRLENYAVVDDGPEIGLFTNVAVSNYGGSFAPFGDDDVIVDVSYDGEAWVSLGQTHPNMPTDVWINASDPYLTSDAGLLEADFSMPYTDHVSTFGDKTYPEIKALLNGSAGGFWLELSDTGLSEVGFIRFSVTDNGVDDQFPINFELDAVSIAAGHVGAAVAPEPCTMSLLALAGMGLLRRRRK